MIGCDCAVCRSTDSRDRRLRPALYLHLDDDTRVLVDAGPGLRSQALQYDVRRVDAILLTHAHADHVMGLDEVRRFNALSGHAMPLYGQASSLRDLARMFAYVFDEGAPKGG